MTSDESSRGSSVCATLESRLGRTETLRKRLELAVAGVLSFLDARRGVVGHEQLGEHLDRGLQAGSRFGVGRLHCVDNHRLLDPMLAGGQELAAGLNAIRALGELRDLDYADAADSDGIHVLAMAEGGYGIGRVQNFAIELTGCVVDGGGPRDQAALGIAADVTLLVGGGHGLLDFDFMAVDRDLDRFLEICRGGFVDPDQPSLEVAGEEILILPHGKLESPSSLAASDPLVPCS